MSFLTKLVDIILPPICLGCLAKEDKVEEFFVCAKCRESIYENKYFICPVCKRRDVYGRLDQNCRKETGLTRFFGTPLYYDDERVRKIIHAFKYQRVKALAKPLAEILIEFLNSNSACNIFRRVSNSAVIVPIPLNSFKERERGFNQAAEIGKLVATHFNLRFEERLLRKIKNTTNQADIKNKEARIKNIAHAFVCHLNDSTKKLASKKVILVDDVYTSGATMKDCARALRKAGAREVWGVTLAR